jgi:hypothetical protein
MRRYKTDEKDHHLLVSELQALVVEAKRRHPDVKDVSVIQKGCIYADSRLERKHWKYWEEAKCPGILYFVSARSTRCWHSDNADTMLSPITLGCKTKAPKIIGIAITVLQRLVAAGGVPTVSLSHEDGRLTISPLYLQSYRPWTASRIKESISNSRSYKPYCLFWQTIPMRMARYLAMYVPWCLHADKQALLLCFKLQDVRVSVVSSTAAATLRQAGKILQLPTQPPTEVTVSPAVMDAYCVLSDLCLLTARSGGSGLLSWGGGDKEKPKLLTLSNLQRTFGLELIESILSGYEEPVKQVSPSQWRLNQADLQRPELVHLLSHSLDALLLKLLAEKPTFPIALRVCRLIFLSIRSFSAQLPGQVEVYLNTLIKLGMGEGEDESKREVVQPWFRVLALEIIRG